MNELLRDYGHCVEPILVSTRVLPAGLLWSGTNVTPDEVKRVVSYLADLKMKNSPLQ